MSTGAPLPSQTARDDDRLPRVVCPRDQSTGSVCDRLGVQRGSPAESLRQA